MTIKTFTAKIFLTLFIVLTIQFLYFGLTTTPQELHESDSLTYHIPIATEFTKGTIVPPKISQGLGYNMPASELILAVFILLKLPLNTFGVLAFVLLFFAAKKCAEAFGLDKETAIIFAGVVVTLQSVLRWPLNQTVDIWLAVFFLTSLALLKNQKSTYRYFLTLGIANGFLIGTKYSGLPFSLIIFVLFGKQAFSKITFKQSLVYITPVFIFGLGWFVRNYFLTGNPVYPAGVLFFKGAPDYSKGGLFSWNLVGAIIQNPSFPWKVIEAMFSEFLIWAFAFMLPIYVFWKRKFSEDVFKLNLAGILIFITFAFLFPYSPIISNQRLIYSSISVLILSAFLLFQKKETLLFGACLLSAMFSLINLNYYPKLLLLALIPAFYLVFVNDKLFSRIKIL